MFTSMYDSHTHAHTCLTFVITREKRFYIKRQLKVNVLSVSVVSRPGPGPGAGPGTGAVDWTSAVGPLSESDA